MATFENIYAKSEIINSWNETNAELATWLSQLSDKNFILSKNNKWSVAENMEHIYISAKAVAKAMQLPKPVLEGFGKPNGPSKKIMEIVAMYKVKLAVTPLPNNPYAPKKATEKTRQEIMQNWKDVGEFLRLQVEEWASEDLDKYVLPHPLLGNMTIREMLFFTILHSYHHLKNMKKLELR